MTTTDLIPFTTLSDIAVFLSSAERSRRNGARWTDDEIRKIGREEYGVELDADDLREVRAELPVQRALGT
jgi:transposase